MLADDFQKEKQELFRKYYSFLNKQQQEAVFQVYGPLLVLAGAGSGKTTVLVNRIGNLIMFGDAYHSTVVPPDASELMEEMDAVQNSSRSKIRAVLEKMAVKPAYPYRILCITFTNKAANEFKERLSTLLGDRAKDIWAGTFHSICVRILRRHIQHLGYSGSFTIYDEDDRKKLITAIMKRLNIDEKILSAKQIINTISKQKELGNTPSDVASFAGRDTRLARISTIYEEYQEELKKSNSLDFDDIIMLTNTLFRQYPDVLAQYREQFDFILVDEYQDTNPSQNELIRMIGSGKSNVCVVGDDDQSIYSFRGATVENILHFDETFPETKIIRLEQNYRSTGHILNAANAVIANNTKRKGKELWTDSGAGDLLHIERSYTQMEEAGFVTSEIRKLVSSQEYRYSDIAVLYRVTALSNTMEQALVRNHIPYCIYGGLRFNERKEIKDVIAYLSVVNNPADSIRLRRIINVPKRSIGDVTIGKVEMIALQEHRSLFDIMEHADLYPELSSAAKKLMDFAVLIRSLQDYVQNNSVYDSVHFVVSESGYLQYLYDEAEADGDDRHEREQNVQEFLSTAKMYDDTAESPTMSEFLEETALVSDLDAMDETQDSVTLMTIHSAKGLEFPIVFLIGFEDGLFPNSQALEEGSLEEERRLAYVAITRAKKKLYITHCSSRMLYGRTDQRIPSRFLGEIPENDRQGNSFQRNYSERSDSSFSRPVQHSTPTHLGISQPSQASAAGGQTVFHPGDRVLHAFFGAGEVKKAENMGGDILYDILFDNGSSKRIMGSFAKLKKEE